MSVRVVSKRQVELANLVLPQPPRRLPLYANVVVSQADSQVGAMAATTHQYIAVVLAMLSIFNAIGGAIGSSVAGAIWGGTFTEDLARFLPPESVADAPLIAGNLTMQLSYPIGSPTRIGIQNAYGNSQRIMLIAATAITVLGFPAVAIWKAIDTRQRKQVKGRVL